MSHYDVVVLGAGPGGYVAAIRAAQLGLNTAVVEPKYWGGVCLNVGCIPSKALLRNAELAHIFTKEAKQFGISGEATFDYGVAFDRSRKVAEGRVTGVHFLMKKNKITEINGYGKFTDDHTLEVDLNEGGTEKVTFDNVIIATGSSTRLVPGTSLSDNVVTYEKLIMTRDLPKSIVIAGAGAIGMEFGYVMKNYGVDVTIVEFLPRALPNEDAEVSKEIEKQFKKLGVKILTGTKVESITDDGADGHRHRQQGRQVRGAEDGEGAAGDRLRAQHRGLRPGQGRRADHRTQGHRHRRLHAHQRAAHLRDRRRHRAAPACPRGRGAGRRRFRNHRRRRHIAARRLPDAAACDVLPAAGGQLRAHRGAGPRGGLRRQGRQVPVHRERQGARRRRPERLRQADRRRASTAS